jgi:selenocysteine lyase/cysteine desulfurase
VSPHLYTTDDELEQFMAELDLVRKNPPTTSSARTY